MNNGSWDVVIIGGGPAGLSAALTLGRCRRSVLVCDVGQPRNRASNAMHCFITRDGANPKAFLETAREQLAPYESVRLMQALVLDVLKREKSFEVLLHNGERHTCKKILLATGVVDHLPAIDGVEQFYGVSVHHCPYCDGWEWRDQSVAVYGRGEKGGGLALMLKQWTNDVILLTDGPSELSPDYRSQLEKEHIPIYEGQIGSMEGTPDGRLERIVMTSGDVIQRSAMFFNTGQHQRSSLPARLGCELDSKGGVAVGEYEVETCVDGVYVAGDASRDVQLVIVAAAEGTKAAFAINKALLREVGRL
jgi:thioredoxin reductase